MPKKSKRQAFTRPGQADLPERMFRQVSGEHLGDFDGDDAAGIEATFGWCKRQWRVNPHLSDLGFIDLIESAGNLEATDMRTLVVLKDQFRQLVHPDDFEAFWKASRDAGKTSVDLIKLQMNLLETLTERPTGRPSDSSDGRPSTDARSQDDSFSRAMRMESGRPDRQLALVRRQEALATG